jgi:hypothetical protein
VQGARSLERHAARPATAPPPSIRRTLETFDVSAFPKWPELFGEPLLARAALDRLANDARQLVITGKNYRTHATRKRASEKRGAADPA